MTSHLAVHFRYVRGLAIVLSVVVALLSASSWLEAHDFWLVPGAFPFADGADVEVLGQTGTKFPASTSAVPANRVARAVMIGAEGESVISDFSVRGTSLVLRSRPTSPGQRIVAADLAARSTRQLPTAFLAYLRLEGAPDAAARIERDGLLKATDSLTRTDVKCAKTLVDVGTRGPRAYGRMSGQVLEFVPQQDAAALATGDTLRLRVLFRGKPLAGVVAAFGPSLRLFAGGRFGAALARTGDGEVLAASGAIDLLFAGRFRDRDHIAALRALDVDEHDDAPRSGGE